MQSSHVLCVELDPIITHCSHRGHKNNNICTEREDENEVCLTRRRLNGFLKRHKHLKVQAMQSIDTCRTDELWAEQIREDISKLRSVMKRYNIKYRHYVISIDESRVSFKAMIGRKRKFAVGPGNEKITHSVVRKVGKLEHWTLMSVASGIGRTYKPVFVFPGKELHYRKVGSDKQNPLNWLPHCYFYQHEIAGVDSTIFLTGPNILWRRRKNCRQASVIFYF